MRIREVNGEIRLYDKINPTFTVMTNLGIYENAGFEMIDNYKYFYEKAKEVIEEVKNQDFIKDTYNDSNLFNDYYMTCIPWLSIEGMTHPLCDNNYESSSVPRICWDKYRLENNKYIMLLNITVSHCFVDGYPLTVAFKNIQENFNNIEELVEKY
jgi:chloramphenicol O-acetyltransferase